MFAQSTAGDPRSVLLMLQGMDTAGKDGVINHVVGMVDPGGIALASFKKPTEEELAHDFLWRIEKRVPPAGFIGVFNRSQYEDVLVVRVHDLVPEAVWSRAVRGDQRLRAAARRRGRDDRQVLPAHLQGRCRPSGCWPGWRTRRSTGSTTRATSTSAASGTPTSRPTQRRCSNCNTDAAPWYVIPSDRKWYRNWAIAALLIEALEQIDPAYPPADFDVEIEKRRVAGKLTAAPQCRSSGIDRRGSR